MFLFVQLLYIPCSSCFARILMGKSFKSVCTRVCVYQKRLTLCCCMTSCWSGQRGPCGSSSPTPCRASGRERSVYISPSSITSTGGRSALSLSLSCLCAALSLSPQFGHMIYTCPPVSSHLLYQLPPRESEGDHASAKKYTEIITFLSFFLLLSYHRTHV